jgi:hypothetical protein
MKLCLLRTLALLLIVCLCGACLVACKSGEDAELPENTKHATIEGAYYRLYLPTDWNLLTETGVSGGYASMQNKAVIYVKEYENPDALSAADYWTAHLLPALTATFDEKNNFSTTSSAPVETTLGEQAALLFGYEGTRDMVSYQGQDVVCPKDGKMYVLTFCARKDLYEGYLNVFDTVKKNFKFSDTPFAPNEPINTVDPNATAPEGMRLASNDDVAYRFYVPASWILDKSLPTSSAYVSESDRSNVNVTVFMPDEGQFSSVDAYFDFCKSELSTTMTFEGEVESEEITLDGCRGKMYRYTATFGGKTYRFAQTIASYRGMIYTVTYTAKVDTFDTHYQSYRDILSAFDFRGN